MNKLILQHYSNQNIISKIAIFHLNFYYNIWYILNLFRTFGKFLSMNALVLVCTYTSHCYWNIYDTLKALRSTVHLKKCFNKRMQRDTTFEVEQVPTHTQNFLKIYQKKICHYYPMFLLVQNKEKEDFHWCVTFL